MTESDEDMSDARVLTEQCTRVPHQVSEGLERLFGVRVFTRLHLCHVAAVFG